MYFQCLAHGLIHAWTVEAGFQPPTSIVTRRALFKLAYLARFHLILSVNVSVDGCCCPTFYPRQLA